MINPRRESATGYRATIVHGQVVYRSNITTGALPGRQSDPAEVAEAIAAE